MDLHEKIKYLIKKSGLKQQDVAEQLGIKPGTFSSSINRNKITFRTLERLSTILKIPVWEIVKPDSDISETQLTQKEKDLLNLFRSFPDNVNSDIVDCVSKISAIFLAGAYYGNQTSKLR
jgi:transcriptional regulator with XRE-family HTH domain